MRYGRLHALLFVAVALSGFAFFWRVAFQAESDFLYHAQFVITAVQQGIVPVEFLYWWGVALLSGLSEELRSQLGLDADAEGLVVRDIDDTSEAYEKGLRAGDLIAEAGQQKITTPGDLESQIDAAKEAGRKSILLLVRREGDPRFVALSLE